MPTYDKDGHLYGDAYFNAEYFHVGNEASEKTYINMENEELEIHELKAPVADNDAATKKYVDDNGLPSQTGNSGKFLTTDGSALSWASAGGGGGLFEIVDYIYGVATDTAIGTAVQAIVQSNKIPIIKMSAPQQSEEAEVTNVLYMYLQQVYCVDTTEEYDFMSAKAANESVVTTYISGVHIVYDDINGWKVELLAATAYDQGDSPNS